jgi:hypothetical protein
MRLILFVQASLLVRRTVGEFVRGCGLKEAQQFPPPSKQRLSSLAALGWQFVHHIMLPVTLDPVRN